MPISEIYDNFIWETDFKKIRKFHGKNHASLESGNEQLEQTKFSVF